MCNMTGATAEESDVERMLLADAAPWEAGDSGVQKASLNRRRLP